MVLASIRAPGAGVYVIQDVCEMEELADPVRLQEAWRGIAQRHPALRTRIEAGSTGDLRQSVEPAPRYEWSEQDWSTVPSSELDAKLGRFLQQDRERGFHWEDGVPMRFAYIRTAKRNSILVWTVHHALLDGRSLAIVWREWLAAYEGSPLAESPESMPAGAGAPSEGAEDYWRDYLAGISQTSEFITDRFFAASPANAPGLGKERVSLHAEETREAHEYARRHGFTAHTLVQGAWSLLLSRYSGREDVVFGVTRAGRISGSSAVGMSINTLPLRVHLEGGVCAVEWLRALRAQWCKQRAFEGTPLDQACRWGCLPAGMAPFDSVLIYDHASPGETLRRLGGSWSGRSLRRLQRTDSPLTVATYGGPEFTLEIIYDQRLFCRETMRPLAGHLLELLRSLVSRRDSSLAELSMLTPPERRWLTEQVNQTAATYSADVRGHQLFEQQARSAPDRTALEWSGGSMSYGELNRQANRWAWRLIGLGVAPEDLIAVCMERSPRAVAAVLAVLKAGAGFLPLRPDLPTERLDGMLETAQPKLVLAEGVNCARFAARGFAVLEAGAAPDEAEENPPARAGLDNAAYAIFTSGSTGSPKAVVLTHRALVNHTLAVAPVFGINSSDRRLQFASMGTDVFVAEVFNYLSCGATLVFSLDPAGASVSEFLRALSDRRITITGVPASWGNEWVAALESGASLPPSLRAVVLGMERVNPAAFEAWRRIAGGKLRWFNAYGPSETCMTATVYEAGSSEWEGGDNVPIGRPLANVRAYVLDGAGAPVPAGISGELYLGGEGVGRGYLNPSEEDAARFLPDPFGDDGAGRMYRTGDLVFRLPDANLVFVGRLDRQVKIRGFRVELEEIEAALALHPGVRQCAVVLVGAEGRQKLTAYVTPALMTTARPADWRAHLARRLPAHMMPAGFVTLKKMPLTPAGKIDRQSLPPFEPNRDEPVTVLHEAATPLEHSLVRLWSEALDAPRVDLSDSFFDLGGDSLAATRLIVLIEKHLGRELPLAALMRAPTPTRMAALLENSTAGTPGMAYAEGPFLALKPSGSRPPLVCLTTSSEGPRCFERLAWRLEGDQPFLVLPLADPAAGFERTVERLAELACNALSAAKPQGPYILGGYCLAGIVAYAAAQKLCAAGADVRLVVLFDAPAPGYPKVLSSGRGYLRQSGEWLRGRVAFSLWDIGRHIGMLGRLVRRSAERTYRAAPASFPVIQFIARQEQISTRVLEDPRLGWREFCPAGFQVFEVGARHGNLFDEESVEEIAARLGEALRPANTLDQDRRAGIL
jgi:amino acid adenylation domain-containing protein